MHFHEKLIRDFYSAFARRDAEGMARCYHPDIVFSDAVFPLLKGSDVAAMWRMLTARAQDFSLEMSQAHADDDGGGAHWEARYVFSKTGRQVHNKIDAVFAFRDGLIVRHIDRFSFWRWAAQALGPAGLVLGWFPPLKWQVRRQAQKSLDQFLHTAMTSRSETGGMLLGLLGVAIFSLTLPATRAAVTFFDAFFVASGRAVVAGVLAACVLLALRVPVPARKDFPALAFTALGVVFGFPFFTTWAMQFVPAIHGAVVLALLPLATALAGALVAHERPSVGFWIMALLGSAVVVVFALYRGGGAMHAEDLALVAAVAAAAFGYAHGAKLSARLGGWQTISWALVFSLPLSLVLCAFLTPRTLTLAPLPAWLGFAYVSIFSMYVGFFPWYKGLALGGIARVGQVQLLQPFLTFIGAAILLGESIDAATLGFATLVVVLVALGRKMPVRRNEAQPL